MTPITAGGYLPVQLAKRIPGAAIALNVLRQRDGWCCQICGAAFAATPPKYPHPLSLSIDHRIAKANGGTHELDNLRLAHLRCNREKGAAETSWVIANGRAIYGGGHVPDGIGPGGRPLAGKRT